MSDDYRQHLKSIKKLVQEKKYTEAFAQLSGSIQPWDDYYIQHRYSRLCKTIPRQQLNLQPIKIGIVSTSTIDHFIDIFRFWMAKDGFDADIYSSDFNTMDQTVLNPLSGLYIFEPEIVWFFTTYRDISSDIPPGCSSSTIKDLVSAEINRFYSLWNTVKKHSNAYIIQNNADLPFVRTFGNYEGNTFWGRSNFYRQFNFMLSQEINSGISLLDLDFISSLYGKRLWFDERYWYHSKHAFSLDASGLLAFYVSRLIGAVKGQTKKCLVLDLDNTLWGGVIGDDGLEGIRLGSGSDGEAYVDFQKYLRELKNRGVILAVCSKNEEENAKQPFLHHPDMQLGLDDISVFIANWNNKADNIRHIAEILNIGIDSIVFIDDNPAERELLRSKLPMVSVPEMPEDPALYIRTVDEQRYFETVGFSVEDKARSSMYQSNIQRKNLQNKFTDLSDYLKSLEMEATVGEFDNFHLPRISQLINKSNQFHLTTTRYSEAQIKAIMEDENIICRFFKLTDRFGDNGLISVVIMQKQNNEELFIDTWVMSCRVLSRGMEDFVHNEIVNIASALHCKRIIGKYIPTKKNKLVADLYEKLGFIFTDEIDGSTWWEKKVDDSILTREIFIERKK